MITLAQITEYIAVNCPIVSINSDGVIEFAGLATQLQKDAANLIIADWVNGVYPTSLIAEEATTEKWATINNLRSLLTVTTTSGHVYSVGKDAVDNIMHKEMSLSTSDTCTWYEDWDSFNTNKVELQEVLILASQAYQTLLDTTLGA